MKVEFCRFRSDPGCGVSESALRISRVKERSILGGVPAELALGCKAERLYNPRGERRSVSATCLGHVALTLRRSPGVPACPRLSALPTRKAASAKRRPL